MSIQADQPRLGPSLPGFGAPSPTPGKRQGMELRTPGWMSASLHSCHPPPVHALILGMRSFGPCIHLFIFSFIHSLIHSFTYSALVTEFRRCSESSEGCRHHSGQAGFLLLWSGCSVGEAADPVFLPGEFPWAEEPGGLQSMGSQRVGHD